MDLLKDILNYIQTKESILNAVTLCKPLKSLFQESFDCAMSLDTDKIELFKVDVVIDILHDKLHTGHWSKVPITTRNGYAAATYVKALLLINAKYENSLCEALKTLDLGILLGGPLPGNENLLQKSATRIHQEITKNNKKTNVIELYPVSYTDQLKKYLQLKYEVIKTMSLPALETFIKEHFNPEVPVVIKDAIQHWPAFINWVDISYLLKIIGYRTVPIEIGSQYSDEDWSQKLMTFEEYVNKYYIKKSDKVGYLAQHDLFYQVPELRQDIVVPDYCTATRIDSDSNEDIAINVWFGPEGTVSSLHYDPKDNLLTQVYGTKQIILASPKDSDFLYPHSSEMLSNTAQVDPTNPNLEMFPNFNQATLYKCLIKQGDMLYIPQKWWHHVTSFERSFSVNFWWT